MKPRFLILLGSIVIGCGGDLAAPKTPLHTDYVVLPPDMPRGNTQPAKGQQDAAKRWTLFVNFGGQTLRGGAESAAQSASGIASSGTFNFPAYTGNNQAQIMQMVQ